MSTLTATETAETAGDVTYGVLKYIVPSTSVPPAERDFFSFPPASETSLERTPLHDYRKTSDLVKGAAGLDVHGFTVVEHQSNLSGEDWFSDSKAEEIYLPEAEALVRQLTGAKNTLMINAAFRRQPPTQRDDKYYKKPGEVNIDVKAYLSEKAHVNGKDATKSVEPARHVHCDYSLLGLKKTIRYDRKAIVDAARAIVDGEDRGANPPDIPRYAAYSVWRPLHPVKRDPLAVLDWQSTSPDALEPFTYRQPSATAPGGEYIAEAYMLKPPQTQQTQPRWFWLPEQNPDEVLVIKLADSHAGRVGEDGWMVVGSTVYGSLDIGGVEGAPRESIEVRVIAFW